MTYIKDLTLKLIRTKHKVIINQSARLLDMLNDLKNVPQDATIDESWTDDDGKLTIVFHHENTEK